MREPDIRAASRWLRVGRVLPRAVRERVFEPAFADLLHRHLTRGGRRTPFGLQVIVTGLACVPVSLRWMVPRRSVLLRVSRVALYSVTTVLLVVALLRFFTRVEGGY